MTHQDVANSVKRGRKSKYPPPPANLEQLLLKIAGDNKTASTTELEQLFIDEAREIASFVDESLTLWFRLKRRSLLEPSATTNRAPPNRMTPEQVSAAVERAKAVQQQAILMDMMIGDKKLRDMTGHECVLEGGWLVAVGKKAGARLVGNTLTEDQLRAMRNKGAAG